MRKKVTKTEHQLEDTTSYVDEQAKIPKEHREQYEEFVVDLAAGHQGDGDVTAKEWTALILRLRKKHKVHPRKVQLKALYEALLSDGTILCRNLSLEQHLLKRQSRSLSGVLVISVLMSPYPVYIDGRSGKVRQQRFTCAHNCYYCPDEPGMPRSYLSTEAAVARATRVDFRAIDQFYARANTLKKLGHDVDKVELLILGGTFCQFPEEYSKLFIRDLYWAANTFYDGHSNFRDKRARRSLAEEIKIHEVASKCRIIGITLETRPDTIRDFRTILKFREYGATRLQIGVQHTDDGVLAHINRGCEHRDSVRAVRLLKNAGYKIDIHLMPNLPGSSAEMDRAMFDSMLVDELMQCDQWKVYPCQTVDFSLIKTWYNEGKYVPYSLDRLMEVIIAMKSAIHPWIRLNRIFRALPAQHITSGITMTNFRQHMYAKMEERGLKCKCIRCREVGTHIRREEIRSNSSTKSKQIKAQTATATADTPHTGTLREKLAKTPLLRRRQYKSSGGDEYFISIESEDESVLMGFVRLRLPPQWIKPSERSKFGVSAEQPFLADFQLPADGRYGNLAEYEQLHSIFPELYRAALVREAHVYGAKQKKKESGNKGFGLGHDLGSKDKGETAARNKVREQQQLTAQSKGYGSKLMEEAERIAKSKGYQRMAVIAGVGTRLYYRLKLGYKSKGTYMVKDFEEVALGTAGKGAVNLHNTQILIAILCVAILGVIANYTILSVLSTMVICGMSVAYMLFLDYLHFVRIEYSKNVNHDLLILSKLGLLAMNLAVAVQLLTIFAPDLGGASGVLFGDGESFSADIDTESDSHLNVHSDSDPLFVSDSDFDSISNSSDVMAATAASVSCQVLWPAQLASYVAGFYLLKMILVKRMVLLVQNPMFGNDSGVRKASGQTGMLLTAMVVAFTACQFLVLHFSDSECRVDPETGMRICYNTFHESCYWVSIAAIIFDFFIYLEFCKRWYAVLLVLMEEIALTLQWQCTVVCVCMVSCVINMTVHVAIKWSSTDEDQGFYAMNGSFAFLVDCAVIGTACVLSFLDSLNFVLDQLAVDPRSVHGKIENLRYALHIL